MAENSRKEPEPVGWPVGYFAAAEDVPTAMREWFTGKRRSAPFGVRFECSEHLAAGFQARSPGSAEPPVTWPFSTGGVGSWADLTGLPIFVRPDLDAGSWQLTAVIERHSQSSLRYVPVVVTIREGNAQDGKPTPLDRDYWLLDLRATIGVDPNYRSHGDPVVRQRLRAYAQACGHDCDVRDIKVTRRAPKVPWELWAYFAVVSVPREPVTYPGQCGDWACQELGHWAKADPVDQPAVFAGAVTEQWYVDAFVSGLGGLGGLGHWTPRGPCVVHLGMREVLDERIAHRRSLADGKPLWTIDIRPKASS